MYISLTDAFLVGFIPYVIILIYHIKIIKYLKKHEDSLSVTSRKVQHDLSRILTAQAIIPIFFAFLPVGFHCFCVILDFNLTFESFILGFLYCWIPVANAITILFFVTVYREKLKQLIFCSKTQTSRVISVSATMMSAP